jgi:ABC-type amino acid transport substrate-binding protein
MQIATIEFARNVCAMKDANSTEFNPKTQHPVISLLKEQQDVKKGQKIGAMVSSVASMVLGKAGKTTSPYAFQTDMVEDLAKGELYGAAVSKATMSYYILQHPASGLRLVNAFDTEPQLNWEVSVGLRKSDQALLDAVNEILEKLLADGSLTRIYAKYGVEHRVP